MRVSWSSACLPSSLKGLLQKNTDFDWLFGKRFKRFINVTESRAPKTVQSPGTQKFPLLWVLNQYSVVNAYSGVASDP